MFDNDGSAENTTIDEPFADSELFGGDPSELEKVEDDNDLCDCDPEYKESQAIQRSRGASLGGFGGQLGEGTTVIVCTNCGDRFYEDETDGQNKDGSNSVF